MRKGQYFGKDMMIPETAAEAEQMGWETDGTTWYRGYVSRRSKPEDWPVCEAGGKRYGELYYIHPCWHSTQYCLRTYIIPGKQAQAI